MAYQQQQGVAGVGQQQQHWACGACTYAGNPSLFLTCEVCSTPRNYNADDVVVAAAGESTAAKPPSERNNETASGQRQMLPPSSLPPGTGSTTKSKVVEKQPPSGGIGAEQQVNPKPEKKRKRRPDSSSSSSSSSSSEKRNSDDGNGSRSSESGHQLAATAPRCPPRHAVQVNNLSDRQYCCVWNVEVFEDGYRPDVARVMLARIARHINPVLRDRGWRVKRLIESCSRTFLGCCYGNGRDDADAASANIKLNLRVEPSKTCRKFYPFSQVLRVMLHEITHISIGLEDIHPPAFYELMDEIKQEYRRKLRAGEVDLETDAYGCDGTTVSPSGEVMSIEDSAADFVGDGDSGARDANVASTQDEGKQGEKELCGVSKKRNRRWRRRRNNGAGRRPSAAVAGRRNLNGGGGRRRHPLLKGAKMIDGRSRAGKAAKALKESLTPRELAARAALARFGGGDGGGGDSFGRRNAAAAVAVDRTNKKSPPAASRAKTGIKNSSCENDNSFVDDEDGASEVDSFSSSEDDDDDDEDEEEDLMVLHNSKCCCRCCEWDRRIFVKKCPSGASSSDDANGKIDESR